MINFFDSKVFNCKGHKGLREGWNSDLPAGRQVTLMASPTRILTGFLTSKG